MVETGSQDRVRVPAIGIDLGLNSARVAVFENGNVTVIANELGNLSTPNYVAFTNRKRLVGDEAWNQAVVNPVNTIYGVKRLIGHKFEDDSVKKNMEHWPFEVVNDGGKPKVAARYKDERGLFQPEEILAMVISNLKKSAENYLGMPVTNAVITVPVSFNTEQRQATMDAGVVAGLNILRIVSDTGAATFTYTFDQRRDNAGEGAVSPRKKTRECGGKGETNVILLDVGAGSVSVSIATLEDGIMEIKSVAGDAELGGDDFVTRIVAHFVKGFKEEHGKDIRSSPRAMVKLRTACERVKRMLSSSVKASLEIDAFFEGIDFKLSITRSEFELLNKYLFSRVIELVEKALKDARMEKAQIKVVILVGGSSRIPKIQNLLRNFFDGKELYMGMNVDEAVVNGAAMFAAVLNGDRSEDLQDLLLLDVTPISFGIDDGTGVTTTLIKRNTTLPTKQTQTITFNLKENQSSLWIDVYEGERLYSTDNKLVGMLKLSWDNPNTPNKLEEPSNQTEVEVAFDIDQNNILRVSAVHKSSGSESHITFTNPEGSLTTNDILRLVRNAERLDIEDRAEIETASAMNSLQSYCFSTKRTLEDENVQWEISDEERNLVLEKINNILFRYRWFDSGLQREKEEYEDKQKELEGICNPIIAVLARPRPPGVNGRSSASGTCNGGSSSGSSKRKYTTS